MGLSELGIFHREAAPKVRLPPVVNFDQIRTATEDIPYEILQDSKVLNRMHTMCEQQCKQYCLFAVALSQIDPAAFKLYDIPVELINGMYISKNKSSVSNLLLLNPKTLYERGQGWFVDACGSIKRGKIRHIVERPIQIGVDVTYYSPSVGLAHEDSVFTYDVAAYYHHEKTHIDGGSIFNQPERIIDFPSYSNKELTERVIACQSLKLDFNQLMQKLYEDDHINEWLLYKNERYRSFFLDGSPMREFPLYQQEDL